MKTSEDLGTVIRLDLRSGAAELDTAKTVRASVARQLGRAGLPEPDDPLFLVIDTPAGLTDHQRQYELLTAYRAVGEVRILVLLVGSAPGSYAGEDEAFQPDRRLVRPAVLRASGTALLWAGDLRSARTALEQPEPDAPEALAVLVDVLSVPDVYLKVLDGLGALPDAVAAPGVRLLEQDLPLRCATGPGATRSSGSRARTPNSPPTCWRPPPPAPICRSRCGVWWRAGAAATNGTGSRAAWRTARTPPAHRPSTTPRTRWPDCALPGLLWASRRQAFEADLDQAHQALGEYRDLVGTALRGGGSGTAPSAAETAARLGALGLRVPSAEGMGSGSARTAGVRRKAAGTGLALRSVAQRFTGLAGRVEPVPGSALVRKLADHSTEALSRRPVVGNGPVATGHGALPAAAVAGLLGACGGASGGAGDRRPAGLPRGGAARRVQAAGRGTPGPLGLGSPGRGTRWRRGGCGGGVRGRAPLWLSALGLLAGLGVAVETARRLWRAAIDSWAAFHATTALREALAGLDALLAEAVREHWAVEERLHCADAARSVAGMLRATAAAAVAEAVPEPERPTVTGAPGPEPLDADDWLTSTSVLETDAFAVPDDGDSDWASAYAWQDGASWSEPGEPGQPGARGGFAESAGPADPWADRTAGVPRWLDRESGEGGPELVAVLAGDLTDAAMVAMEPYWGAVERGQAGALAVRRTEERVRDLLSTARRHLQHNGVLAPPRSPPTTAPGPARRTCWAPTRAGWPTWWARRRTGRPWSSSPHPSRNAAQPGPGGRGVDQVRAGGRARRGREDLADHRLRTAGADAVDLLGTLRRPGPAHPAADGRGGHRPLPPELPADGFDPYDRADAHDREDGDSW